MAKDIFVVSRSTPDKPGWNDTVEVWEDGCKLWEGPGSAAPSPYDYNAYNQAKNAGKKPRKGDYTWDKRGGMIDYGAYRYDVVTHDRYGKSLVLNQEGYVDSRIPNRRHPDKDGNPRPVMNEIFVHRGDHGNEISNRGSEGCITIHPDHWARFQNIFKDGERGRIFVIQPPASQGMGDIKQEETRQSRQEEEKGYDTDVVLPWG